MQNQSLTSGLRTSRDAVGRDRGPNVRTFARDVRGTVALIFALTAILIVSVVGGAVDFGRWYQARSQIQNLIDAAVLAGGRMMQTTQSQGEALAAAQSYFDAMKSPLPVGATPTFTLSENDTVLRATLTAKVQTPFLSLISIPDLPIDVVSEAVLASGANSGTNIEVSMMLDITGSMGGQKIADLKTAAKDMIDIVIWDDQAEYTSKIALAPFAPRVNVGSFVSAVTGLPATKSFSGNIRKPIACVTERTGSEEFTDAAPGSGRYLSAYRGDTGSTAINNANNYSSTGNCSDPSATEAIVPLSNDKTALKARIDSLNASGTTAGMLGTAWAWYLISPNWSAVWPSTSTPSPYAHLNEISAKGNPRLKKIAVLMSDGIYNTIGGVQYGDNSSQAQTASSKAVQLCTNMKAAGITVYTVGFALGGSQLAINTLKSCASREPTDPLNQPSYFYNTSTGDELRQAFREIALQIATLRLRS